MRQSRSLLVYLCLCLLPYVVPGGIPAAVAQDSAEEERLLKAVFIYNFAKFTRWPESVVGGEGGSLTLCTAGKDELAGEVARLSGKMIKGHSVTVKSLKDVPSPEMCQVLYIASSESRHYRDIVASVSNKSVLTVSELPGFARSGGIIELYRERDRIRFKINLSVAREAGLAISSRLLSLAEVVGQEGGQ